MNRKSYTQLSNEEFFHCLKRYSGINKVSLVEVSSYNNTESIRDDPYWTSRKNSLELIELSRINKVILAQVSSYNNAGSMRDDSYWASKKNSLELKNSDR